MTMDHKTRTDYAINNAGLPQRHIDKIEKCIPLELHVIDVRDKVRPMLKARNTVIIRGSFGSGKTHMACEIGYWWPGTGMGGVRYHTVCSLLIEAKDSFGTKGATNPIIDAMDCGLLILDELLANTGSVFDQNSIREIVDSRYRNLKPTIILTNLDDAGLLQALDQPTIDRAFDGGCMITVAGKSLRVVE